MAITSSYSPEIFTLVPMSQLSKRHFDLHPIWSEFYDYEEREEIVSWGVDQKWLEEELENVHSGNDHCAYPVLRPYPLPERMRLYIRARFITASGMNLEGYVMNEDAFVVTLFVGKDEHNLSRHPILADLNAASLRSLQEAIGRSGDAIFPLKYETDFLGTNDALMSGTFLPSILP